MVCLYLNENILQRNNISFKNNTEKVVLLQVEEVIQIFVKFNSEKVLGTFWIRNIVHKNDIVGIWKWKAHFRYTICFMISKISIMWCTFHHRGACMHQKSQRGILKIISAIKLPFFIGINSNILTEGGRNFKIFLKENSAIALDSYHLFTKKWWTWNWTWYW